MERQYYAKRRHGQLETESVWSCRYKCQAEYTITMFKRLAVGSEVGFHSTKPFVSVHLVIWRFREGGGGCFVVFLLLLLILCYCRFYHKTRSPSAWNMSILISSGFSSNIVDVRRLGVKPATM